MEYSQNYLTAGSLVKISPVELLEQFDARVLLWQVFQAVIDGGSLRVQIRTDHQSAACQAMALRYRTYYPLGNPHHLAAE